MISSILVLSTLFELVYSQIQSIRDHDIILLLGTMYHGLQYATDSGLRLYSIV